MQITGGKVSFKRSYQPEQYGSKGAEVEISFMMAEGEELGTKLDDVAKIVKTKALQLCNIKTEALGNAPPDVVKVAEKIIEQALAEPTEAKAEKPAKAKGRTKADLEAEKIAAAGGGKATVEAAKVEPEGEDLGATFNEDATPEPEIPDTELSSAMNATVGRLNPSNGNTTPKLIKALIQTFKPHDFPADGVFKSGQIPQNMRKQFLAKLKEMK
jgi:hypothetical protein